MIELKETQENENSTYQDIKSQHLVLYGGKTEKTQLSFLHGATKFIVDEDMGMAMDMDMEG